MLLNEKELRRQTFLEQWNLLSLSLPSILVIILIIIVPVGWLFYLSFTGKGGDFSLANYEKMITYKSYARVFMTTFQVSFLTTLVCILMGYPLAYFMAQLSDRMAAVLSLIHI